MTTEERFLNELAVGIVHAGGAYQDDQDRALALARKAWAQLKEIGTDAFPCMVELEEMRFVYQWDETPPLITVMLWDDQLWRDMYRIEVPAEIAP